MKRVIILLFSFISYLIGIIGLIVLIMLLNGWKIHSMVMSTEKSNGTAWLINISLLLFFVITHSVMAQTGFKTRLVFFRAIERSLYVSITGLQLILLTLFWQPLSGELWQLSTDNPAAWILTALSLFGWFLMISSTYIISHSDLFGLRQAWLQWKKIPYTSLPFQQRGMYKLVRHPQMTGMIIAFWFTPDMTTSRLLFNVSMTLYILIGIHIEEKKLIQELGSDYQHYRQKIPMLFPKIHKKSIKELSE